MLFMSNTSVLWLGFTLHLSYFSRIEDWLWVKCSQWNPFSWVIEHYVHVGWWSICQGGMRIAIWGSIAGHPSSIHSQQSTDTKVGCSEWILRIYSMRAFKWYAHIQGHTIDSRPTIYSIYAMVDQLVGVMLSWHVLKNLYCRHTKHCILWRFLVVQCTCSKCLC